MEKKVITFGCRLNACESETIRDFAAEMGLDDFTVINTCAVTEEAERKLRQTIRKLRRENEKIKIILTGCASELNPDYYMKMEGVVGIISNNVKLHRAEYAKYASESNAASKSLSSQKIRGFLQIQNGCDQKCTYCIVKLTRGPNVSLSADEIVQRAKQLLRKGYKEIVLTGVNISAYGRDFSSKQNLASIIRHILKNVPDLGRLRLSSLDPADMDEDLLKVIKNEERLMPHFHESIQSGDDIILKRMMRRHTRQQIKEINCKILEARPDAVLGADIIVGFPTETDEMFLNTKKMIVEASISLLHLFPFSARPGTSASLMPMIEKNAVKHRLKELKQLANDILAKKLSEYKGKNIMAIAENEYTARTNSFLQIKSTKPLIIGAEYLFHCDYLRGNILIGVPH
ncbi:MAG: tRNA (N(6)-L-threonylcarbamoyladenosine(37)-C(2))-methylthiotransferase MtaB [Holosporaceae bacterium]|jgi:threonylcarbamoyladenosine tRNA methylthiotransferase MtaB|nr:tRNA (N(6)-L-threonylcarbamoyladenosine(37)-C(2))-methylthiotransferase MtaB [Holosporaceae bacterium]